MVKVRFNPADCRACPAVHDCINSPQGGRREIVLRRSQEEHEALRQARRIQQTDGWKGRYKIRAGIEGTIAQATQAFGMRRSRYCGLARTSLQHQLTGTAINLARIDAWLTATPRSRTSGRASARRMKRRAEVAETGFANSITAT